MDDEETGSAQDQPRREGTGLPHDQPRREDSVPGTAASAPVTVDSAATAVGRARRRGGALILLFNGALAALLLLGRARRCRVI